MAEIDRGDLWNWFVGIGDEGDKHGYFRCVRDRIYFPVRTPGDPVRIPGDATTPEKTLEPSIVERSIKESDLNDIVDIFCDVSWKSVPLEERLLWLLWVREKKFWMYSPLKKGDQFVQRIFAKIDKNIDDETVEELFNCLSKGGYLHENSTDDPVSDRTCSLTPKGDRAARRMFKKTAKGSFAYDKSQSFTPKIKSGVKSEPTNERRNKAKRIKKIKKTVRDFWVRTLNGENVLRHEVAKDNGWEKEHKTILSKPDAKAMMKKISAVVAEAKKVHGDLKDIDDNIRTQLLLFVHKVTK